MLSSHNILHPAHGKPIAIPSQDMVLGCAAQQGLEREKREKVPNLVVIQKQEWPLKIKKFHCMQ